MLDFYRIGVPINYLWHVLKIRGGATYIIMVSIDTAKFYNYIRYFLNYNVFMIIFAKLSQFEPNNILYISSPLTQLKVECLYQ
jgi:hypothetical protein